MASSGVHPWLIEFFGLWGSSAIRAYIEDSRARSPAAASLAKVVAQVQGGVTASAPLVAIEDVLEVMEHSSAHVATGPSVAPSSSVSKEPSSEAPTRQVEGRPGGGTQEAEHVAPSPIGQVMQEVVRDAAVSEIVEVHINRPDSKVHLAWQVMAKGPPSGRATLCGWHFGKLPSSQVQTSTGNLDFRSAFCRSCLRRAGILGLIKDEPTRNTTDSGSDEASSESLASPSSG